MARLVAYFLTRAAFGKTTLILCLQFRSSAAVTISSSLSSGSLASASLSPVSALHHLPRQPQRQFLRQHHPRMSAAVASANASSVNSAGALVACELAFDTASCVADPAIQPHAGAVPPSRLSPMYVAQNFPSVYWNVAGLYAV